MLSVDGCGQGDIDSLDASCNGIEGVFQLRQHTSGNGAVGLQTLKVFPGDGGNDAFVIIGIAEDTFLLEEKMSVTS